MAQLSIFEKQRHHSKKDFTCSIGKKNYIYITFRHDSWKRFTSSEHIKVERMDSQTFRFSDPVNAGPNASVFKLKTDKKGDPKTREHTRYLQIDGNKYPGFLEVAQRVSGSYDVPKAKPNGKSEAEAYLQKIMAESNQKAEPAQPTLGDLFQEAIDKAVRKAFWEVMQDTRARINEAKEKGYEAGYLKGKAEAEKEISDTTVKLCTWTDWERETLNRLGKEEAEDVIRKNLAATMLDQIAKLIFLTSTENIENCTTRFGGTLKVIMGQTDKKSQWEI